MSEKRIITYEELKAHTNRDDLYILLNGNVYDVTKFLDEHPGGDEVLLAEAGRDATEAFEDIGHSDEARSFLPKFFVGEFERNGALKIKSAASANRSTDVSSAQQGSNLMYLVPLAILGGYFAWRYYSS